MSVDERNKLIDENSALTHAHEISLRCCEAYVEFGINVLNGMGFADAYQAMIEDGTYRDLLQFDFETVKSVELSSFVLKSLKADAERELETEIGEVVISVPAYFNAFQREATISAAKLAGLTVTQLISEPTAASLAYGIDNSEDDQNFLVVDLGGGTFDVSLISMFEQVIQVEAIAGDTQLGGEDFTFALVDAALAKIDLTREKAPNALIAELYEKAEGMKKKFANRDTLAASFDFSYQQQPHHFQINGNELREIMMPLLARLQKPTKRVMNDSQMNFTDLDKVILVGGATRLKVVQEAFSLITGLKPATDVNPDEAVALGATIRAHMLKDDQRDELIMTDVIGFSLGTEVQNTEDNNNPYFAPIIERNSVIPTSIVKKFYKQDEKQRFVAVGIYQGELPYVRDNLKLGEIKYPAADLTLSDSVAVRFSYDESGILEVEVSDEKYDQVKKLVIQNRNTKLSDQEIAQIQNKLAKLKVNPLEQDENKLILVRFERLYVELLGDNRENIRREQSYFIEELNSNNPRRVATAQERANELLTYFEELI